MPLVEFSHFMQQLLMEKLIKSAALSTPDPERAFKNLSTFCDNNPEGIEKLEAHIGPISLLFSYSQFLSVFCVSNPDILFDTLADINTPRQRNPFSLFKRTI